MLKYKIIFAALISFANTALSQTINPIGTYSKLSSSKNQYILKINSDSSFRITIQYRKGFEEWAEGRWTYKKNKLTLIENGRTHSNSKYRLISKKGIIIARSVRFIDLSIFNNYYKRKLIKS